MILQAFYVILFLTSTYKLHGYVFIINLAILLISVRKTTDMSMPPYLLGPNPWAQMMAQQQLAAAHAQAQAVAAQAQAHAHAMQQQMPPPHPKPDIMTEDKLQEKGNSRRKY